MASSLGITMYGPVWGGLLGTLILMANWIESRSRTLFEQYVDRVSECNADLGMDLSVDQAAIAMDLVIPGRDQNAQRYAEKHGMDKREYTDKIIQHTGRPLKLVSLLITYTLAVMLAFGGPALYYWTGLSFAGEYFACLLGFTAATLMVYFLA